MKQSSRRAFAPTPGFGSSSRRDFLGGLLATGLAGGCRMFAARDFRADGRPNIKFGVISDIHIRCLYRPGDPDEWRRLDDTATFRSTLAWFRDQGVDAVIIAGDLADDGVIRQLEDVATVWYSVFPNDTAPDGRPVEKLFITGNHESTGVRGGRRWQRDIGCFRRREIGDAELAKLVLFPDPKTAWERIFHEPYAPIWKKSVKGYDFVGANWLKVGSSGWEGDFNDGLVDWYARHAREFDPSRPFFHIQHPHPRNTCYGNWTRQVSDGTTKALSAFPNAVSFSGHTHYSLTDERSVWQGAYTSIGTASLSYLAPDWEQHLPPSYENARCYVNADSGRIDALKLLPRIVTNDCRQGMLCSVYDDCFVLRRRDFLNNLELGDDWVLPLSTAEAKPFAFATRAKKFRAPRFAAGAKLKVVRARMMPRGDKRYQPSAPLAEKDVLQVTAPAALPDKDARAWEFEFAAIGADGTRKVKLMQAEGFDHASAHPKAKAPSMCPFALDELPRGPVRFEAVAISCFGKRSAPLVSESVAV